MHSVACVRPATPPTLASPSESLATSPCHQLGPCRSGRGPGLRRLRTPRRRAQKAAAITIRVAQRQEQRQTLADARKDERRPAAGAAAAAGGSAAGPDSGHRSRRLAGRGDTGDKSIPPTCHVPWVCLSRGEGLRGGQAALECPGTCMGLRSRPALTRLTHPVVAAPHTTLHCRARIAAQQPRPPRPNACSCPPQHRPDPGSARPPGPRAIHDVAHILLTSLNTCQTQAQLCHVHATSPLAARFGSHAQEPPVPQRSHSFPFHGSFLIRSLSSPLTSASFSPLPMAPFPPSPLTSASNLPPSPPLMGPCKQNIPLERSTCLCLML